MEDPQDYGCCQGCHRVLRDPFIECVTCQEVHKSKVHICLECYAKGRTFGSHESSHAYTLVKHDFSLFSPNWSAQEETRLLDSVLHHGLGSWEEVCKTSLPLKTSQECQEHFESVFIQDDSKEFGDLTSIFHGERFSRAQPVPSNVPSKEHSLLQQIRPPAPLSSKELAGYNPARGDFDTEPDDRAEEDLSGLSYSDVSSRLSDPQSEDDELLGKLELSALYIYNDKLKERSRKKGIVREHGLINKRSVLSTSKYPLIQDKYNKLYDFRRLLCAFDFDYLLEGLQAEFSLRRQIRETQEFRSHGLTRLDSTVIYKRLKVMRESNAKKLSEARVMELDRRGGNGRSPFFITDRLTGRLLPSGKKAAVRLDISGLPSYAKLSETEQSLCSEIRLTPESFLHIKDTMVSECKRCNGLKLADARPAFKIDVNKTRKIYDLLINEGVIYRN
eukprot:TRINITY_DN5203_c0_g1_i1.p1 TRINITY_DN5203_c0_g1~~TRINITY_DN5203_c0_g1_i1.p1  ORF type:complete len:446 (-),score=132.15 TRINITY_DN5203_c0_g1_i1:151-1488(-)